MNFDFTKRFLNTIKVKRVITIVINTHDPRQKMKNSIDVQTIEVRVALVLMVMPLIA